MRTPRRATERLPNITARATTRRVVRKSAKAHGQSKTAHEHSEMAHGESQAQK